MVLAVALMLAQPGCGRDSAGDAGADPGISDKKVTLGGSYPLSGPASAYGAIGDGARAYFEYRNARGGIAGRKVDYKIVDDGYEPPRALQNARRLIQQDKVFALFNTVGTPTNLAIWDFANQEKVPHLFVTGGASVWGSDVAKHPYTIGWQPNYLTEAKVYAGYLKQKKPNAKVAVLYQNDGFGKELLRGFEKAVEGTSIDVVDKESYVPTDPTVATQVRRLARSGADTFLDITTPKFSAQAISTIDKSGWKPLHILTNVGASKTLVLKSVGLEKAKGIVSTAYYKDPEDTRWADDPAVREYRTAIAKYSPKTNADDAFVMYGWTSAATMAKALEGMKKPTRAALMESVRNLDTSVGTLLPGNRVTTGPGDAYPIDGLQIQRFDGQNWKLEGGLIRAGA